VFIANADGSNPRLLSESAAAPAWSPNGRFIAVANMSPRGIGIFDVAKSLAGKSSAYRQVTTVGSMIPEEYATWSPDGKRLAFTSHRTGDSDIWVVDVTGKNLRNLTKYPEALDDQPSWSPDGRQIAFGSSRASGSQDEIELTGDIYVMDVDGKNVHRLTRARGGSYAPAWSPDGRLIAFNSQRDGNSELYVMQADGSDQRRLTRDPEADGIAAWVGRGCTS
jgi:TolB protein